MAAGFENVIQQFAEAMRRRGLVPPQNIIGDGKFHRCDVAGGRGRSGRGDGAYILHLDGAVQAGGFQNHKDGKGWDNWSIKLPRNYTPGEEAELKKKIEIDKKTRELATQTAYVKAAAKSARIWNGAAAAPDDHPYLVKKHVGASGLRTAHGMLIMPARNAAGEITTLQIIAPDGSKRFLKEGRKSGCFHIIGDIADIKDGDKIYIAEGFATAATIRAAMTAPAVVAFDTGNLSKVVEAISAKYPSAQVVVCADDDWKTDKNPGVAKALVAALGAYGSSRPLVAVPEFGKNRRDKDTDFNDLADTYYGDDGADRVRKAVAGAALPEHVLLRLTEDKPDDALKHETFLAKLKAAHPSEFEAFRKTMKARGVRAAVFDEVVDDAEDDDEGNEIAKKQVDLLLAIAREAYLFNTGEDDVAWADITVNGHRETWPVKSSKFKQWLRNEYYKRYRSAAGSDPLNSAVATIEAKAILGNSLVHNVGLRVMLGDDGAIWINLCDDKWRAIRIDKAGWKVVDAPEVRFTRKPGMMPLPIPIAGGDIGMLRKHLNVAQDKNDENFVLAVAWLLGCFRPEGPYAVLHVHGEHGAAKTTFLRLLRRLIDPNKTPDQRKPKDEHNLYIAARNRHVLVFDNFSSLSDELSDSIASLVTGGSLATRELYENDKEVLFTGARPIALNGISRVVTRPDLADRALFVNLSEIPKNRRKTEEQVEREFDQDQPKILGAILTAVAHGLATYDVTNVPDLPRMADFAKWVIAGEGALWAPGTFMKVYGANRSGAVQDTLADDDVATAIRDFMEDKKEWAGTHKELLTALGALAGETIVKRSAWPKTERKLRESLGRAVPFLRQVGISIAWKAERTRHGRLVTISHVPPSSPDPLSDTARPSPSPHRHQPNDSNSLDGDGGGAGQGDGPSTRPVGRNGAVGAPSPSEQPSQASDTHPSHHNPLKTNANEGCDDGDGCLGSLRGSVKYDSIEKGAACAQCKADGPPLHRHAGAGYPPEGVHLHPECVRFYLRSRATA